LLVLENKNINISLKINCFQYFKNFRMKFFYTSRTEIKHLLKAWLIISLAFAIASSGLSFKSDFLISFIVSALTVGIGFLFHELAHKIVAQKYECFAEFRANTQMLILALIISFTGFIFVAPGAVFIQGNINREKNGKVSAAGPLTNMILALLFMPFLFTPSAIIHKIAEFGMIINIWIAIFNMLPFWNFDGMKVLMWSRKTYIAMLAAAFGVSLLQLLV